MGRLGAVSYTHLILNGAPHITDGSVALSLTGTQYTLDSRPLNIEQSRLNLKDYKLTLQGKETSLYLDGWLYLFGPEALKSDLRLYADHAQVIDSKYHNKQSIYGRAILSADLRLQGYLTAPQLLGSVTLHGGTNATYVMSQATIKAQDNMSGVVEFVNVSDTTSVKEPEEMRTQSLGRMDLSVALHIEPAVPVSYTHLLLLQSSTITNMGGDGLTLTRGSYTLRNSELSNVRGTCLSMEQASVQAEHLTVVSDYLFDHRRSPVLYLSLIHI